MLTAQSLDGAYLKSCADLKNLDAQIACTDSTLLEDIKVKWSEIKNEVEQGNYNISYTITSRGEKKAERVTLIPQRVVLGSNPELLLELVEKSVQEREWVLPECDDIAKNYKFSCGVSRSLNINTTLF